MRLPLGEEGAVDCLITECLGSAQCDVGLSVLLLEEMLDIGIFYLSLHICLLEIFSHNRLCLLLYTSHY